MADTGEGADMEECKRCARCKEHLPREAFGLRSAALDRLNPYCSECAREYARERYRKDPDKIKANVKAWRDANPEAVRKSERERHQRDRSKRLAAMKAYGAATRDQRRAHVAKYNRSNRARIQAYQREWRKKNRRAHLMYERRREAMKRGNGSIRFTPQQLDDRMRMFGFKCWVCGVAGEAVDHVKPLAKGGPHMLANLRPICMSCNSSKGCRWPLTPEELKPRPLVRKG